ncbi:uncharacterized protein EV154DRAFT_486803 [Mucor mucedo]|uniref:uncharacterized protein n=1 Tax=Mucor mucedo TaxID=29922 RepID=UPI002220AD77|nr:uncharacterized protein EV154DRAFT_486803 [Mucor mucedo]KAI7875071.1 hypothetical protein EV154DRAFT_486803 [Mucor mucedo]
MAYSTPKKNTRSSIGQDSNEETSTTRSGINPSERSEGICNNENPQDSVPIDSNDNLGLNNNFEDLEAEDAEISFMELDEDILVLASNGDDEEVLKDVQRKHRMLTSTLELMMKCSKVLSNDSHAFVPAGIPFLFQWKSHVLSTKRRVFKNIEACVEEFENIVATNDMNLDTNWARLLPGCLSEPMKKELQINHLDNKKYARWNQIRDTLIRAYGKDINEAKSETSNKLFAISMKENGTVGDYNMRFKHCQAKSGVIEESTVVRLYKKGLANHLQKLLMNK